MHVLLVEPDIRAAEALVRRLNHTGHTVELTDSGRTALQAWRRAGLILLDLTLPDLDGVEVCRGIRANGNTPIITFTASGTETDRVLSLQAGADDCMVKPYGYRELVARMNAVVRRGGPRPAATITHGPLHIDPLSRQVRLDGRVIEVTRKEFDLLHLLASVPQSVLTRRDLMARVWSDDWAASSRTVDTHISTLRSKLGCGDWIVTVRGIGYRLGHGT